MKYFNRSVQCLIVFMIICNTSVVARQSPDWLLEKMPADLERDYALSALPPDLRKGASVYLLDPAKGYYLASKGSNGFVTFVARTEWEWSEFRQIGRASCRERV